MHHPHAAPWPSLHHDYNVHAPWLPRGKSTTSKVTIVGAGPAGLVTALELARHGVPSTVLASELQVSHGSRAIVFTRRTLEILQQVGVADDVVAQGLAWRVGHSHYRGQKVFRMEAPHDEHDRFAPLTNLQQPALEALLVAACERSGLVEIRWGNHVTRLDPHLESKSQGVSVTVDTPEGPYTLDSDWVVAVDGGRSPIRTALKLPLEGAAYEGKFVIADILIDLPLPTERLAYFDPEWNRGNTVLMHKQPKNLWRIDYQLPSGETPEQALAPESLKTRIDAQLAMVGFDGVPWTLDWFSVYAAKALTLADYVHGRVIFAGDAAHLLPIFGVRGANTAFQDAQSLGWHLAHVVKGLASASLMHNYSAERVGAAREIIDEAGKSTRFMTPPTRGHRLVRDAVLSLSLQHDFVRPLYHWRTSRPHAYTQSDLNAVDDDNARFTAGPGHGEPPRNVKLAHNDFLLDHLGGGFDLLVHVDGDAPPSPEWLLELTREVASWHAKGLTLHLITVGHQANHLTLQHTHLPDTHQHLRRLYGMQQPLSAYLFRPDQHVCARWLALDAARLGSALQKALGTPAS
jgi:3-(3-hydroxy-phenyl)propionate hydroxylase